MKAPMKHPRIYTLASTLLLATVLLSGCDSKDNTEETVVDTGTAETRVDQAASNSITGGITAGDNEQIQNRIDLDGASDTQTSQWQHFIGDHSSGWVPAREPLYIDFNYDLLPIEERAPNTLQQAIKITPELPVVISVESAQRLLITPQQPLASGQIYSISINATGFDAIADDTGDYQFAVQALQQDLELQIYGLTQQRDQERMTFSGAIETNDSVEQEKLETVLSVVQGEQQLPVKWQHLPQQRRHEFVVENIVREAASGSLQVQWDGAAIGVAKRGARNYDVPAIDQFAITAVHSRQQPQQHVDVAFSEALDRNQNLTGLVRLNGEEARVRIDGSHLRIYPSQKLSGEVTLTVEDTIRSSKQLSLSSAFEAPVTFISELPGVRFLSSGAILPPAKDLHVPFEAINVNAVWVTAFKTYSNNMPAFLAYNDLRSTSANSDHGRYLWKKKISLPDIPRDTWQRYHIELDELMQNHPDDLINIRLSLDPENSLYNCDSQPLLGDNDSLKNYPGPDNEDYEYQPNWYHQYYHPNNGYLSWRERNNPCHSSFYQYNDQAETRRNFMVSSIGLLAKRGSNAQLHIVSTNLKTAAPLPNTEIELFNYQNQSVAKGKTDTQGMLILKPDNKPFYLIARSGDDIGYLRVASNHALPTSQFDTGGSSIKRGLKGFIYGERDVWRPGDTMHLTFVLEDRQQRLPQNHPVSIDLFDPKGVKVSSQTNNRPAGNLYTFSLPTDEQAPTGNWRAVVHVGGDYFSKDLKVETIKPNRLKIELSTSGTTLRAADMPIRTELKAQWLSGAIANNLKADSEIKLSPMATHFEGYSQFHFDDPASNFENYSRLLFEGPLSSRGETAFHLDLQRLAAPGKLRATFVNRVFENSGEFSRSISYKELLPYEHWVGLNIPEGSGYRGAITRDQDHTLTLQSIDSNGSPQANRELDLRIYKLDWRWWWDQSHSDLANYINDRHVDQLQQQKLLTDSNGRAQWTLEKDRYPWGRYLIRACDKQSRHCTGKEIYLGWSWDNQVNPDAATQLMLATDKKRYQVGDTAVIKLPQLSQGQILYSLENGSRVLEQKWLTLPANSRSFEVPVTDAMAPNAYVSVTLLLPHESRDSDAPIRLFGVIPLLVDNPASHLQPVIEAPDSVRPESEIELTVREQQGRAMNYTVALVDEGLLGITNFQTPNPHASFFKKEALGVATWDMFDSVAGAYGANLERLLRIGGGQSDKEKDQNQRRRFPPVVKFLGAFQLAAGESRHHKITLPNYMGAVRLMVVAADDGAYGNAEKSVTVTQPLTLLTTLPRVLGPGETLALPINVFANNDSIRNVKINVEASDLFLLPVTETELQFDGVGDQIAMLNMQVADAIGGGTITVSAEAEVLGADGKVTIERAHESIYIESRSANSARVEQLSKLLQPGEIWQPQIQPHGLPGTNKASVAVSSLPPLNLDKRLEYLIRYPHGCIEQTTSAALPQLTLHQLLTLSEQQRSDIQTNVDAAIKKLARHQTDDGDFSYWPGQNYSNPWASSYATHFMVRAKQQGYAVPQKILANAIGAVRTALNRAEGYAATHGYQAYVLSLNGTPDLGAMNRLRERLLKNPGSANLTRQLLALAYATSGLTDISAELLASISSNDNYRHNINTYGSPLRDQAIALMALDHNTDQRSTQQIAWNMASAIANELSGDQWHSTQSTAWALMALSEFGSRPDANSSNLFALNTEHSNGKDAWQSLQSIQHYFKQAISTQSLADGSLQIRNDSEHPLYAQVANQGVPAIGDEQAASQGLIMDIDYTDLNGNALDVNRLPQGQDLIARVKVGLPNGQRNPAMKNIAVKDIALSMVMPSGWQIRNRRLEGEDISEALDYQDLRDDRVNSYFSLWQNYNWRSYNYRYSDRSQNSVEIEVMLNASYAGRYYLPGWEAKAMYNESLYTRSAGQWVEVVAEGSH